MMSEVHLAITVDQPGKLISHYVNGRLVTAGHWDNTLEETVKDEPWNGMKLRLGQAEIGNWSPVRHYDAWPTRSFNGRIDELSIHSKALSGLRIQEMYQSGNPGRE